MNPFDDDTALTPAGEGRWRGDVRPGWSNGAGPGINGGLFAALVARAAREATGLPPRSLTIHYLQAPELGPVDVTVTVTRRGRSTAFCRLELLQDEGHVAQAMAVCSRWRDDAPVLDDARFPPVTALEDALPVEPGGRTPPLVANYELRVDVDPKRRPPAGGGWIRTAAPRPSDEVALAAMTDAFMPPVLLRRDGEPVVVPTLELTIHFRGEPPAGEHPWIAAWFVSRTGAGGVLEEDGELWSADGRLLAQSRQLSVMRRREAR